MAEDVHQVTEIDVERRLEELQEVIFALVAFNYQAKAPLSDRNDIFDGMAAGLNMLGEELAASTISKKYVLSILQSIKDFIVVTDSSGAITMVNDALCEASGYEEEELVGKPLGQILPGISVAAVIEARTASGEESYLTQKGGGALLVATTASVFVERGQVTGIVCVARDLTQAKRAEEERLALRDAVNKQAILLDELLTPIIPIADDVLILPIIGSLSDDRARRVTEALLQAVVSRRARLVLLDITGLRGIDATVVQGILRAVEAVKLIGADIVLTGIRPEVAALMVTFDINLDRLVTYGTLQAAIQSALGLRSRGSRSGRSA